MSQVSVITFAMKGKLNQEVRLSNPDVHLNSDQYRFPFRVEILTTCC